MRRLAALTLLGASTLAGCGDGPSYTRVPDGVLKVDLDEYTLRPENIEVPAGTIHLVARNRGRLTHNLAIEAVDRETGEEATTYGRTDTLQPGQTGREREPITLKPGKYRLVCTIGNHDDLGQYGELKVVAKGS
jgi:uncharacterized cupredoxin-like copper-binding protein